MRILKTFSPNVEIYSIDEAFIDLSFLDEKSIEDYGKEIRRKVLKWTGIPTSVGISFTKTLSKVANNIAKKEIAINSGETNLSIRLFVHINLYNNEKANHDKNRS